MNVLMVVHQFLPRHVAGSEIYTYRLAQALAARGHQIWLFFTEIRPDRPQYELTRGEFDGIPYFEAVHNRYFASFGHSYRDPEMERRFADVLTETSPDVLHVQHLYLHSIGYLGMARQRALPIVYTLHEFMLLCLNGGLLLRPGPTPCPGPEPQACAACAAITYPGVPASRDSQPTPARRIIDRARRALARSGLLPRESSDGRAFLKAIRERRSAVQAELENVDLFVAPSRFLRERFIAEGIVPSERIIYSDNGFYTQPFQRLNKARSASLRVGYIGTISEFKGVHLIIEAFRLISDPGVECRIFGDLDVFPDYKRRLLAAETPAAVRFMGPISNDQVPPTLAELDVLIVPSLWPENSPLTIHEAFLAGTPVLAADHGGMAELVEDGKSGLHFRAGDAADLRRQILRLLREPGLVESLGRQLPPIKTIEEDAAATEERYRALLQGKRPLN